mmetsp:Transcript_32902/g.64234  ORF Transcript_32902/g.64234 Transcript_32902/m.64234 type:complete len:123 (+) Transcript_32902:274-642(+)
MPTRLGKRKTVSREGAKPKKSKVDDDEVKLSTFSCVAVGGKKPPVKVADLQKEIMTTKTFLKLSPELEIDINDNRLTAKPRTFTSGNKGWYTGGKIKIQVGDETVWCQAGINITVLGSKEWD